LAAVDDVRRRIDPFRTCATLVSAIVHTLRPLRNATIRAVSALVLILSLCGSLHAATEVELEILGDIKTLKGIDWQVHEGELTAQAWQMQGDWFFNVVMPNGKSVAIPVKQMYQFEQNMGVLVGVKLYPEAGTTPFDAFIERLPSIITGAGFSVDDASAKTIATWKATSADTRNSLGYESIDLSPDEDVTFKLSLGSSDQGKSWHYCWEIKPTRAAAQAVYKAIAR
jgi:hypothetical protein